MCFFFFSSRRRHTRCGRDWSSDVCSSDLDKGKPVAGVLVGERVYPAAALLKGVPGVDTSSTLGLLQTWDKVRTKLKAAAAKANPKQGVALKSAHLLPPLLYPTAVFCAGGNYW